MDNYYEDRLHASRRFNEFNIVQASALWVKIPSFPIDHLMMDAFQYDKSYKNLDEAVADAEVDLSKDEIKIAHSLYENYHKICSAILNRLISKVVLPRTIPYEYFRREAFEGTLTRSELEELAKSLDDYPEFLFPNGVDDEGKPIQAVSPYLDKSSYERLSVMIEAANHFWAGIDEGDNAPPNKTVAAWIEKKTPVSATIADKMASIIRPDWAKDRTWKENKKR